MNSVAETYKYAKNYIISEHKVIIWSKRNIFHGNLNEIRVENYADLSDLHLKESDFEISTSSDFKTKKASKLFKKAPSSSASMAVTDDG